MKPQAILKQLIWYYQKVRLGHLGEHSDVTSTFISFVSTVIY